jgi:hypothetical protein
MPVGNRQKICYVYDIMKMIRSLLIITFCSALSFSQAQDRNFGLGLILGEPTGISFKYYVSADRAIDGALAWRLWRGRAFHVHADHLWHNRSLINVSSGSMPLYFGTAEGIMKMIAQGPTWACVSRWVWPMSSTARPWMSSWSSCRYWTLYPIHMSTSAGGSGFVIGSDPPKPTGKAFILRSRAFV